MPKTVLVTGGAGGLGSGAVERLSAGGWRVFAADLPGPGLERLAGRPGIQPVELDVTAPASIEAARAGLDGDCDGLDGVVNFAGILGVGPLIEMPEAELQRVLDVNVLGTFRVNQAFFPLLQRKRGRIIDISSETGWQSGGPFNGPYAMSKHAIEAYSDSLRRELAHLGIRVIKIQPGAFKTDLVGGLERAFGRHLERTRHFAGQLEKIKTLTADVHAKAADPGLLAAVVQRALEARRPRAAYSVRPGPQRYLDWLPTRWADAIYQRVLRA